MLGPAGALAWAERAGAAGRKRCEGAADLGLDCLDVGALRAVFELLQNHYPERCVPGEAASAPCKRMQAIP